GCRQQVLTYFQRSGVQSRHLEGSESIHFQLAEKLVLEKSNLDRGRYRLWFLYQHHRLLFRKGSPGSRQDRTAMERTPVIQQRPGRCHPAPECQALTLRGMQHGRGQRGLGVLAAHNSRREKPYQESRRRLSAERGRRASLPC